MVEETKHEKFVRLRDKRLPNAIKAIELVGNLASPNYEFDVDEAHAVRLELLETVDAVMARFRNRLEAEPEPDQELPDEFVLASELDLHMITDVGPFLDRALRHLEDGETDVAQEIIIKLMRA